MADGWGSGWGSVGWRGAVVAAAALALAAPGGAVLADDSLPSLPTPVGSLVVADAPNGLSVGFAGAGPAEDPGSFGVVLDPGPPPAPADPPRTAAVDRDVSALASCALAATGCGGAGSARLARDLLPLVLGTPADLLPPGDGASSPNVPTAQPPGQRPLAPFAGGQLSGIAPALDAVAIAFGPPVTAPFDAPEAPGAPAPAPAAPPDAPVSPAPPLATTGTPIVAALSGLVLLAVGGFLTWARARD